MDKNKSRYFIWNRTIKYDLDFSEEMDHRFVKILNEVWLPLSTLSMDASLGHYAMNSKKV